MRLCHKTCKTYSNPPKNDILARSKTKINKQINKSKCDVFPINKVIVAKAKCISKVVSGNSIKKGCQCCFVAKKPYLDPSMCMLIYESTMHVNSCDKQCLGSTMRGFLYVLGVGISEDMKYKIAQLHAFGLSPT